MVFVVGKFGFVWSIWFGIGIVIDYLFDYGDCFYFDFFIGCGDVGSG